MPKDYRTSFAGLAGLGFIIASFFVQDPVTQHTLMGIGVAFGSGGLMAAADSKSQPAPPPATVVVAGQVGKPPADLAGK